jgi:hypothetical protein
MQTTCLHTVSSRSHLPVFVSDFEIFDSDVEAVVAEAKTFDSKPELFVAAGGRVWVLPSGDLGGLAGMLVAETIAKVRPARFGPRKPPRPASRADIGAGAMTALVRLYPCQHSIPLCDRAGVDLNRNVGGSNRMVVRLTRKVPDPQGMCGGSTRMSGDPSRMNDVQKRTSSVLNRKSREEAI